MNHLSLAFCLLRSVAADLRHRASGGRTSPARDVGLSTLEVVVIALGLFLIAGTLVIALKTAVETRLGQIN